MTSRSDLESDLLAEEPPRQSCGTCAHPGVVETLRKALEILRKAGKRRTVSALWRIVRRYHPDYTLSLATFRRHCRECQPEVYEQSQRGGE